MIKKLLLTTLTLLSISQTVFAGERMAKEDNFEVHKECFMVPVIVKQEEVTSDLGYKFIANVYYDGITGSIIDKTQETIYIDAEDNSWNRWYFPYDGMKFHTHNN